MIALKHFVFVLFPSNFLKPALYNESSENIFYLYCKYNVAFSMIGKTAQAPLGGCRDIVYTLEHLLRLQKDPQRQITWYQVLNRECVLVFSKFIEELVPPFLAGQPLIASEVTARSRQYLVTSLMKSEKYGYTPLYTDVSKIFPITCLKHI